MSREFSQHFNTRGFSHVRARWPDDTQVEDGTGRWKLARELNLRRDCELPGFPTADRSEDLPTIIRNIERLARCAISARPRTRLSGAGATRWPPGYRSPKDGARAKAPGGAPVTQPHPWAVSVCGYLRRRIPATLAG